MGPTHPVRLLALSRARLLASRRRPDLRACVANVTECLYVRFTMRYGLIHCRRRRSRQVHDFGTSAARGNDGARVPSPTDSTRCRTLGNCRGSSGGCEGDSHSDMSQAPTGCWRPAGSACGPHPERIRRCQPEQNIFVVVATGHSSRLGKRALPRRATFRLRLRGHVYAPVRRHTRRRFSSVQEIMSEPECSRLLANSWIAEDHSAAV